MVYTLRWVSVLYSVQRVKSVYSIYQSKIYTHLCSRVYWCGRGALRGVSIHALFVSKETSLLLHPVVLVWKG